MKKAKSFLFGVSAGVINSLLGAGAGILAVPFFRSSGLNQKSAQATSLAVILPLSAISMVTYLKKGYFTISDGICFIPFGIVGVLAGAFLTDKLSAKLLSIIFYLFLLYSGLKMLFGW